jgi:aspartyl-tRNA(Asn)/glutamyl-tRNA(Gln) amidotransferase subunit A
VSLSGLRVAVVTGEWFERLAPPVADAFAALRRVLEAAGVAITSMLVPDAAELHEVYRTVQAVEARSIHQERLARAPELFDPEVRQRLEAAASIGATEYAVARRRLDEVRASAADRLSDVDILALPTTPVTAPEVNARDTDLGGGWTVPRDALLAHDALWGVLGLPALSLPIPAAGPLPVGAQLVARPGHDEELLAAALAVEAVASPAGQAQ